MSRSRPSVMDSLERRYAQLRASARRFPVVEFGVSCFAWDARARGFRVDTFEFPIFPVAHDPYDAAPAFYTGGGAAPAPSAAAPTAAAAGDAASPLDPRPQLPDRRFLLQAKCLQYIRAHGFDLNRWVDDGIGYLSHDEQRALSGELSRPPTGCVTMYNVDASGRGAPSSVVTLELKATLDVITSKISSCFGSVESSDDTAAHRHRRRRSSVSSQGTAGGEESERLDGSEDEDDRSSGASSDQRVGTREVHAMKKFLQSPIRAPPPSSPPVGSSHPNPPCPAFVTEPLAPFRRHAIVHHIATQFPEAMMFDCPADNDESGEHSSPQPGSANSGGNPGNATNGSSASTPWRRRVRVIMPTSAPQKAAIQLACSQLTERARRERNAKLVGFTAVLDLIVLSRKPIVGHNMLLDLLQCTDKFHEPLPPRCAAFQSQLHEWICEGKGVEAPFPSYSRSPSLVGIGGIFDTKEMMAVAMQTNDACAALVQPHSALEHCFTVLSGSPFVGPRVILDAENDQNRSRRHGQRRNRNRVHRRNHRYDDSGDEQSTSPPPPPVADDTTASRTMAHQAGYDAFMTGCVFLRLCSTFGVPNAAVASLGDHQAFMALSPDSRSRIEGFRNVLHVSHILPAASLRLPGPFPRDIATPSRSHFVRVRLSRTYAASPRSSVPGSALKSFHIKQCLSCALSISTSRVTVHWEGKECVYVALPSASDVENLIKLRAETPEQIGTANDPMPSIGCVDFELCEKPSIEHRDGEGGDIGGYSSGDDERSGRKRKSSEIA